MSEYHGVIAEVAASILLIEHLVGKTKFRSLIGLIECLIFAVAMVVFGYLISLRGKNGSSNN